MNNEYEKRLEAEIDRELKGLPELAAPSTLVSQVMTAAAKRSNLPWYRQSWLMWSPPLRVAALAILLALFGGLCLAGAQVTHAESFAIVAHKVGGCFGVVTAVWSAVTVLLNAVFLVVKQLGSGFIIACSLAAAFGYALCVGLGTVYMRLAFARR